MQFNIIAVIAIAAASFESVLAAPTFTVGGEPQNVEIKLPMFFRADDATSKVMFPRSDIHDDMAMFPRVDVVADMAMFPRADVVADMAMFPREDNAADMAMFPRESIVADMAMFPRRVAPEEAAAMFPRRHSSMDLVIEIPMFARMAGEA